MLAWFGAEVIKIERPGGDPTRTELLDLPGLDSLYYLQLNANKKSMVLNAKTPEGKEILTTLIKGADVFIENLHPGAAEALGFGWNDVHAMNPRCIYGTIKGFNEDSPFAHVKAFEPVAQSAGGAASTTGWWSGPDNVPTQSGAALGDSNTGMHLLIGILAALLQRSHTGEGCYVQQSMQDAVINLCRVKLRDQLMLENMGTLKQYPQSPNVGDVVPRGGNIEGGQVVGWCYKCKGWETDPNAYVYIVLQNEAKAFALAAEALGKPEWITDPKFSTPEARNENKQAVYAGVEEFTITRDKIECVNILSKAGVPCGPVLNWKEIKADESLYKCGTLVKMTAPQRGEYVTIGCPPKFSNFAPDYRPAPALGENTDEILTSLGYTADQIAKMKADKVCG
jgi:formyl-CoA transferase